MLQARLSEAQRYGHAVRIVADARILPCRDPAEHCVVSRRRRPRDGAGTARAVPPARATRSVGKQIIDQGSRAAGERAAGVIALAGAECDRVRRRGVARDRYVSRAVQAVVTEYVICAEY